MADWFIATEGVKVVKDSASVNATMFDRYGNADDFWTALSFQPALLAVHFGTDGTQR
ncbi:hypothetical protein [Escherichia coli]|uniref:hypothetical protein n=1 Tax=Escherichia coli TaxID=562 RepID=UPI001F60BAA7|nr:hypothetical protein [Escherichia coli]